MAALGAAHRLRAEGVPFTLFDKAPQAGGHTRSYQDANGFSFDEGPHISFTKDERVKSILAHYVGRDFVTFQAKVNNYWQGYWLKHPAQCNLHGLPIDVIVQIMEEMFAPKPTATPTNYAEWLVASYGRFFAENFPMRYGHKYHTLEARQMSLDWLGPRLYQPSMKEVLTGALSPVTSDVHYVSDFRYPRVGGFQAFLNKPLSELPVRLDHELTLLDPQSRTVFFRNGLVEQYDRIISSIPLPDLIKCIPAAPKDVRAAAANLACTTCVLVNIGVDRSELSEWHWTYFYDEDYCFSRVSYPKLFSPENCPPGTGSIQCELYFSNKYRPLTQPGENWIQPAINDLRRCGVLRKTDSILSAHAQTIRYANVIFDLARAEALATVHAYLDENHVHYCGRYGEWGYLWTDESFLSGERAAQRALDSTEVGR
jgi:protoporphyrinogen oxidase